MVKKSCVKNGFWLAITLFVIANLSLGSHIFAKQLEIKAADVERIKTSLEITQTTLKAVDLFAKNNDLMAVLNTIVKGGKTGTDITYGLLVLSALNEMDLVDLVISQQYKIDARNYFNQILDERTSLRSYWKGISYDLPKVISGYITGPMAALTLNSFDITDKAVAIFVGFNVLEKMKLYDGLWYYFDTRKQGNESHKITWEETKIIMGLENTSLNGLYRDNGRDKKIANLEQQFLTLYETWESYVTPFGISEKYKKQVKEELSGTLIAAAKENAVLVENEPKSSLIDKLAKQLERLKEATAALITKINPFEAGVALNLPEESTELVEELPKTELKEVGLPLIDPMIDVGPQSIEPQPVEEVVDIIEPEIEQLITTTPTPELPASTTEPLLEPELEPEPALEPLPPTPEPAPIPEPVFCERDSGNPARFRVLINEVAWIGTANSTDNEWIELKNVWGIPVNLNGWQFLDKDRQIKIIFDEDDIILAGGYYLLERTDDNSTPDAKADLIYTGALGNSNEALYLFDPDCRLEDEVLANPDWPAGDNSLKKPMARLDVLDWYTSVSTPGSENGSSPATHSPAIPPTPSPITSSVSPQIFITETYIGSDGNQKDDFVELYNPNLETIDLNNYYIQRKTENAQDFSTYISHELLVGKTIGARNYFLIANASSTFATSADVITTYPLTESNTLVLKDPNQKIIDQVSTNNPGVGKSYGRRWSSTSLNYTEDFEAQTPTPRAQNQNSAAEDGGGGGGGESLSVVINEIAWMGTINSTDDEWIELYNNTSSTIDLAGWSLVSSDGSPNIIFSTSTIAAHGFYLLERTNDTAIFDIIADQIYTGALTNGGEKLELKDASGVLIDTVDCSSGWFAGDNSTKQTMEKINPLAGSDLANWAGNNLITKNGLDAGGNPISGTPKAENSVTKNYTILSGGITFSENFTLRHLGSPYISDGPIHILSGATLSIEPGVIIKLKHGSSRTPYAELKVEGSLNAPGGSEQNQKIVFTSYRDDEYGGDTNNDGAATQPTAGDWDWVYFKDSVSDLQNVIVRYGGKLHSSCCGEFASYTYGAIYIDGGQLTMSSSIIEKSETLGVWINNSSITQISGTEFKDINTSWSKPAAIYIESGNSTINTSTFIDNNIGVLVENFANPAIENNIFNNNQKPIQISTLLPTISGNTFNNNNYNGLYLTGLALPEGQTSMVWKNAGSPYIINTLTLSSGLTLQVDQGVIIKFLGNGRLNIEGSFEANGTTSEKIVFTSIQDDEYGGDTNNDGANTQPAAGRWHYVYFAPLSSGSILENVIVRYGGWYNVAQGGIGAKSGVIKADGANLTIKNSLFESNLYAGLELINSTTTLENTAFNKNEYGIYVGAGDCPNLSGVTFGTGANANLVNVFPSNCAP